MNILFKKWNKSVFSVHSKECRVIKFDSLPNLLQIKMRNFNSKESPQKENKSKGLIGKIKQFGKFGIVFYSAYVAISFIGFYILLHYKVIKIQKVVDKFEEKGLSKYLDIRSKLSKVDEKYVNVLGAYLLNQIFEVVRFPTTILILTYIFRKKK